MRKPLNRKQKFFHFVGFPIISFIFFYILMFLSNYLLKGKLLAPGDKVTEISASALGVSIGHWLGLFYPPPKKGRNVKERKKSVKEYIRQYLIEGSTFNRIIIMIYLLGAILVILLVYLV